MFTKKKKNRKHHEMRIFAKKLRYTLEVLHRFTKMNLQREIETIKEFQDILGRNA